MGSTISCRVSAANAGKSRRMGKAKRTAAADEPAGTEGGTNASAGDDGLIALLAAGLRLQASDNLWRVSGNTLPHRLILRDAGGAWNRLDQCWEFTGEDPTPRLKQALDRWPASPANGMGHNSGAPGPAAPHYHGHRARLRQRVTAGVGVRQQAHGVAPQRHDQGVAVGVAGRAAPEVRDAGRVQRPQGVARARLAVVEDVVVRQADGAHAQIGRAHV